MPGAAVTAPRLSILGHLRRPASLQLLSLRGVRVFRVFSGESHAEYVADQRAYGRDIVDRKTVGKVDHLEGIDKIKLTKQSSPDGQHHHFIPLSWIDHIDQHVHLNKTGADVTSHWEHEERG